MIGTIIFIITLSRPFPTCFGLKRSDRGVFLFFEFFLLFFFNSLLGAQVGNDQNDNFCFSLFLGLSQLAFARKETIMVFLNFLNFFPIFLEFSIMSRVENERNNNFYFHSFSAFPKLVSLGKKP